MFREAAKREQRGDNLTGKQNVSTTVGSRSLVLVAREWVQIAGLRSRENAVRIAGLSSERMGPDHWSQKERENGSRSLVSEGAREWVQITGLRGSERMQS